MSYPGTLLISDCHAGIINSGWTNNESAKKERLMLISIVQEQLFTYEVEEWKSKNKIKAIRNEVNPIRRLHFADLICDGGGCSSAKDRLYGNLLYRI